MTIVQLQQLMLKSKHSQVAEHSPGRLIHEPCVLSDQNLQTDDNANQALKDRAEQIREMHKRKRKTNKEAILKHRHFLKSQQRQIYQGFYNS